MLCIYHNADLDGFCSAAIVKYAYPECELYGANYGDALPPEDVLNKHGFIVMVDFSYKKEDMLNLATNFTLVYIDHHKTAIADMEEIIKEVPSTSYSMDTTKAACQLAWEFFFDDKKLPRAVELCAKHDLWIHDEEDVWAFQYGMRSLNCGADPNGPSFDIWKILFIYYDGSLSLINILDKGTIIYEWEQQRNLEIAKKMSFEVKHEGLTFLAINAVGSGSAAVEGVFDPEKHDAALVFSYTGKNWKVSLYAHSSKNVDMDLSVIAKKYGGGGHRNAAGFYCDTLPEWVVKKG